MLVRESWMSRPPASASGQRSACPALFWILGLFLSPASLFAQDFVGPEVCQACHEDIAKGFVSSAHRETKNACESCHGPGSKHAESASATEIRNPKKLAPAETDRACLTCHLNQKTHAGRIQG